MHWAAVSFLNASLAWMTGAFFVRIWLTGPEGTWTDQALRRLDTTFLIACIICGVCSGVNLWIAAAAMGDVPLLSASGAFQTMIISTNYGRFGLYGLTILAVLGFLYRFHGSPKNTDSKIWLTGLLLVAFMFTRAAVSHAAEAGLFSLAVAMNWLHIVSMSCWVGIVVVSAFATLPYAQFELDEGRRISQKFLASLSTAATVALIGILATGVYNAYNGLRSLEDFVTTNWGQALAIKLGLVALAVALGGFNRFVGFPAALDSNAGKTSLNGSMQRLKTVLLVESALLLGAVIAAAVLASEGAPAMSH